MPAQFTVEVVEHGSRSEYLTWLETFHQTLPTSAHHRSSPIVWFKNDDNSLKFLGGKDDTLAWLRSNLASLPNESSTTGGAVAMVPDGFAADHSYDFDLVVIGGGSGGLACSKQAQKLGAKVAVLDFVKPSPIGSKWGLGGTCVNVGCIPKKLMHNAAVLGEHIADAKEFGWIGAEKKNFNWKTLRENVQNHIKGLNFGYRVELREAGITYLNKLGKFLSPHELECTDAKGQKQVITAARFVVAVGGRPTPLACPGAEYAITSDDLFMLDKAPGKTCVVGAGYVALECAGFLTGLNQGKVTVLVRSMMLRGFDRDVVSSIHSVMTSNGTVIVEGALPKSIQKLPNGKLLVTYGDSHTDTQEEFDTVLAAIGRAPDLPGLGFGPASGLEPVISVRSGKLVCKNEQTSIPHIYAIGDVIHEAPELTPVAIMAGKLLAKRLFDPAIQTDNNLMVYKNIATTVFTPLELGTVGLNEEEAIAAYGPDLVDCFISRFTPLEWSIHDEQSEAKEAYAKVVVLKNSAANTSDYSNMTVLGLHIAAPNAGEIIQGFAVAFRKGMTYKDLTDTVGIHPTVAEEFTGMSVLKSSGASATKAGC